MENKIKVLLVDDEADFTQPLSFWLKSKGYDVIVASGGQEGINLVRQDCPNIMFLDLNMPGIDGVETLRRIREFNPEIPVIIISAYLDDKRITQTHKLGISGVFYKEKDFSEGLSLLETALRMHKNLKKD